MEPNDNMENELKLTELLDVDVLQRIQNAFAVFTGMASITTDADGIPVTQSSNFTDFCMEYTRKTSLGRSRCEKCDKIGAQATLESGKPAAYFCHAGLIDYAAPIVADGRLVGCFIGGQVLTGKPDPAEIKKTAEEIGVDPDELYEAALKVPILGKEGIDNAAKFLYTIANVLSDMAYGKYLALQANKEMEKATKIKSDFLANMSHEIRTPMNAVIGMAEMALREDLPPAARDYIHQIKASGNTLLMIINDILDFSKIDSGKMDIVPIEYEIMSVVNDICNIIVTRLKSRDVEFLLDISPKIPHKLLGDNLRIKQILLNIANNAVKFTSRGKVVLHVWHEPVTEDEIRLCISVEDTGIGIKKADLEKIFRSFEQVDSKRNRNIEGTGLGLAISRQLVSLMNGKLWVESEYEKGSTFSFVLPQKVVDSGECIRVKNPENILSVGLVDNLFIKLQLETDCTYLGVEYQNIDSIEEVMTLPMEKRVFVFIECSKMTDGMNEFIQMHPAFQFVLLINFDDVIESDLPNLLVLKKPLYTLNEAMIFNGETVCYHDEESDSVNIDFIAPTASVLIVDDNAINLTVAEGLLEPLKMKIDTALSGKEAIAKISVSHYDIVFMDHMMPELDGVETTHIIRRFHAEYSDVPIIALTANAVDGIRDLFLREGMNDFIAKPIELKTLVAKVKKWLPEGKIQNTDPTQKKLEQTAFPENLVIGDLDTASALKLLGSEKLFWSVLKDYYRVIEKKSELIRDLMEKEDWENYTIEVHALKSASRQVGAVSLAEKALRMEEAGNRKDISLIRECTDDMLLQYRSYLPILKPYFQEKQEGENVKRLISVEILLKLLDEMQEALDDLDSDHMENVVGEMMQYHFEGWQEKLLMQLKDAVEDIDVDTCAEVVSNWKSGLV